MGSINYTEKADSLVNNWKFFENFGMENREAYEGFCIVYTHNRDSRLIERVNAEVYAEALEKFAENDATEFSANHWAVGWVAGHAIRVFDASGNITKAFRTYCDLNAREDDYPVLDERRYAAKQDEEAVEYMAMVGWDSADDELYEKACEIVSER